VATVFVKQRDAMSENCVNPAWHAGNIITVEHRSMLNIRSPPCRFSS